MELPVLGTNAYRPCTAPQHGCGHDVRHVPHVARSHDGCPGIKAGQRSRGENPLRLREPHDPRQRHRNLRRGQGLLEFDGNGLFPFVKRNGFGECPQIRVEHPIQHLVGEHVVTAAQQLRADLGFGNHDRALGHLLQPLPQGLQLLAAWRTPEVPDSASAGTMLGACPPLVMT